MKVSELIEKLKEMPQDMEVYVTAGYGIESLAEIVETTMAYGQFECVEIS